MSRFAACLFLLLALHGSAHAQRAQTAVVPEDITVGDVFQAALRMAVPAGADVVGPDSLELPADLEHAGRRQQHADTAGAADQVTLVYPLTAWRPGEYRIPPVTVRVISRDGEQLIEAEFPAFRVRSVLPADTAGIEMRGAKDVLGPSRIWWPWLLGGALLLAALLAWLAWRRSRVAPVSVTIQPEQPAHDVALARLHALRQSGMLEAGHFRAFHIEFADTLRHYATRLDPRWTIDLTTRELAGVLRGSGAETEGLELVRLLSTSDEVKFARARTTADAAARDLDAAIVWVTRTAAARTPPAAEGEQAA